MKGKRGGVGAYRKRTPSQVHVCEYCGNIFYAKRSHAKTCSGACRVALCRRDKKIMDMPRVIVLNQRSFMEVT